MPARRSALLSLGILLGGLLVALGAARSDLDWEGVSDWVSPALESESEPVLVFVVGGREPAGRVLAAVDRGRVVARTADGFALAERRVVVSSIEALGELLVRVGWEDAPLDLLVARHLERGQSRARGVTPASDGGDVLAELMQKRELTYVEAQRALDLL